MAQSNMPGGQSAHWEDFWRDAKGDRDVMGGARQRPTLAAFWRARLGSARLSAADLVLDIASGAAPIARIAAASLAEGQAPHFVCVDYAPAALDAARSAGARISAVAGDARRLPFRTGVFAAVVSQFGLEYVGRDGFSAVVPMLAPGGVFAALIHFAGGVIHAECAENRRVVRSALDSGLFAAARVALETGYARGPAADGATSSPETAVRRAFEGVGAMLKSAPPSAGREVVARYAGDVGRLVSRRAAYAPDEALGWLGAVESRLEAYAARMSSMIGAAVDAAGMSAIAGALAGAGLTDVRFAPLGFDPKDPPGAWSLDARRP